MKKIISITLVVLIICSLTLPGVYATDVKFTRASFCKKIADTLQSRNHIIDASAIDNPFPDLTGDEDYYAAILWMTAMGYIRGYEDGTFKPENYLTRGEVAHWLVEMLFGDVTVPDDVELENKWYAKYVWKVTETGIMPNVDNWDNVACENDIDYDVLKEYAVFEEITILIDGEKLSLENDGLPILKNEVVMAPFRQFCEALGATTVSWIEYADCCYKEKQ